MLSNSMVVAVGAIIFLSLGGFLMVFVDVYVSSTQEKELHQSRSQVSSSRPLSRSD